VRLSNLFSCGSPNSSLRDPPVNSPPLTNFLPCQLHSTRGLKLLYGFTIPRIWSAPLPPRSFNRAPFKFVPQLTPTMINFFGIYIPTLSNVVPQISPTFFRLLSSRHVIFHPLQGFPWKFFSVVDFPEATANPPESIKSSLSIPGSASPLSPFLPDRSILSVITAILVEVPLSFSGPPFIKIPEYPRPSVFLQILFHHPSSPTIVPFAMPFPSIVIRILKLDVFQLKVSRLFLIVSNSRCPLSPPLYFSNAKSMVQSDWCC